MLRHLPRASFSEVWPALHCERVSSTLLLMKKLLPIFILAALTIGGMFAYDRYQLTILSETLMKNTATIVKGYEELVDSTIVPLQKNNTLTEKQALAAAHLAALRTTLANEKQISVVVSLIHDVQLSLVAFLRDLKPDQPYVNSAEVALIQREMSKNGKMRDSLNAYNETAALWNHRMQSGLGSLRADIVGNEGALLPYLRFDGEQEYLTTIHL